MMRLSKETVPDKREQPKDQLAEFSAFNPCLKEEQRSGRNSLRARGKQKYWAKEKYFAGKVDSLDGQRPPEGTGRRMRRKKKCLFHAIQQNEMTSCQCLEAFLKSGRGVSDKAMSVQTSPKCFFFFCLGIWGGGREMYLERGYLFKGFFTMMRMD